MKVTEVVDCCVCVKFQSVIKAVVGEVDDALQLLHSEVYFTLCIFYSVAVTALLLFTKLTLCFTQLKRAIVSVALWVGEHDNFHNK